MDACHARNVVIASPSSLAVPDNDAIGMVVWVSSITEPGSAAGHTAERTIERGQDRSHRRCGVSGLGDEGCGG